MFFEAFNRGKRSISLDLTTRGGRAVFDDLVRGACTLFGITEREFYSVRKVRPIPEARAVAWIAMRQRGMSYPEIGWVTGRNHTTILTACQGGRRGRRVAA